MFSLIIWLIMLGIVGGLTVKIIGKILTKTDKHIVRPIERMIDRHR